MDSESTEQVTVGDSQVANSGQPESTGAADHPALTGSVEQPARPRVARPSAFAQLLAWNPALEWLAASLLTVAAIVLHVVVFRSAGGLWRDEINSTNLAAMQTLAEVWKHIEYDSFPIFWVLVLRCWQAIIGDGDTGYRILGMCVGLACVAALWRATRRMINGPPLISLALVGLSPIMLRFGDSLRAWGFGILWMWLMMTAVWDYSREPSGRRWLWAAIIGVLSVQASYYNAFMLFAAAMGGCTVCLARRDWKTIAGILGAGVLAAVSLLPYYAPIARHRSWVILVEKELTYSELLEKWEAALNAAGSDISRVWMALCVLAIGGGLIRWVWQDKRQPGSRDVALFSVVAMVVGSALYLVLLQQMHRITESWYFLTWMAFAGLLADVALGSLSGSRSWIRLARWSAAVAIGVYVWPVDWRETHIRHSNVDLIAKYLSEASRPKDLVAVLNWEQGITFQRYYHGQAPWLTVPDIAEHRIHRYDLVKEKMEHPLSIDDTIAIGLRTLDSGGRVWIVGDPSVHPSGSFKLPPPPLPDTGWHSAQYAIVWNQDFKFQLFTRATQQHPYSIGMETPTAEYERSMLQMWFKER